MDPNGLERWLHQIARTEHDELSCSECFDLLDAAVEEELQQHTDTPAWRRFSQHLDQCPVCREEYETLKEFVRRERAT